MGRQISSALAHCHARGVLHLDIKASPRQFLFCSRESSIFILSLKEFVSRYAERSDALMLFYWNKVDLYNLTQGVSSQPMFEYCTPLQHFFFVGSGKSTRGSLRLWLRKKEPICENPIPVKTAVSGRIRVRRRGYRAKLTVKLCQR